MKAMERYFAHKIQECPPLAASSAEVRGRVSASMLSGVSGQLVSQLVNEDDWYISGMDSARRKH